MISSNLYSSRKLIQYYFFIDQGVFIWKVMLFKVKNGPLIYQKVVTKTFRKYLDNFMKIFLDDFTMYSDMESCL
jgi:hypothetical protein